MSAKECSTSPGRAGTYALAFTPSTTVYPNAGYLPSAAGRYTYAAPTLTRLSLTKIGTAGGDTLTITGTALASLNAPGSSVRLVSATTTAGSAASATAIIKTVTPTSVTVTVPPAPRVGTSVVTGNYHVVLTSPLGSTTSTGSTDVISYTALVASLSAWSTTVDAAGTVTGTVTGVGLAGSTNWVLAPLSATTPAGMLLPNLSSESAVRASTSGVYVASDTKALVRLPANPGKAGVYTLTFTPSQTLYPASTYQLSSAARYTYSAPQVTKVSLTKVNAAGGQALTITGTSLATMTAPGAGVRLVNVANAAISVASTVTACTATSVTITLPAAPKSGTAVVAGSYHVVLTSPLGQAAASSNDLVTYTLTAAVKA